MYFKEDKMKLQAISSAYHNNNPIFGDSNKNRYARRENVDRTATVQDLYEMEDRIIAKNKELFKKQNRMLGDTILSMMEYMEMRGTYAEKDFRINASRQAKNLSANGVYM